MIKCEVCNRTFKNKRALGGHMSNAHAKPPEGGAGEEGTPSQRKGASQDGVSEASGQTDQTMAGKAGAPRVKAHGKSSPKATKPPVKKAEEEKTAPVNNKEPSDETESESEKIRNYFQKGYTFDQLTGPLGFKVSTVRQEIEKLVPPEKGADDSLPVVRKMGGGMEIITPEALLRRYMDGDSDEKELRGIMKMRASMLMVMDLVDILEGRAAAQAKLIEPILELMKESRDEQDAAALRARASVDEAARKAAEDTAARLAEYLEPRLKDLEQKKPDATPTANPMVGMMSRTMETLMNQMLSKLGLGSASGGQNQAPTGFTYEKRKETESNG